MWLSVKKERKKRFDSDNKIKRIPTLFMMPTLFKTLRRTSYFPVVKDGFTLKVIENFFFL